MRLVYSTDGTLSFVGTDDDEGKGFLFSLSYQQIRILYLLDQNATEQLSTIYISSILFGLPRTVVERRRSKRKMTASQRASLSRSLRRLKELNIVENPYKGDRLIPLARMTDDGREFFSWIKEVMGQTWDDYNERIDYGLKLTGRKQNAPG